MICSLLKPDKYSGKRRGACASEISTIGSENQVKTYMDSSNGVRNASSNAYNKVRASAVSLIFLLCKQHVTSLRNLTLELKLELSQIVSFLLFSIIR